MRVDRTMLEALYQSRNMPDALFLAGGDPLMVARSWSDSPWAVEAALTSALFAYGNVRAIVGFLQGIDFALLGENETTLRQELKGAYYRFQRNDDTITFLLGLQRLGGAGLYEAFCAGFATEESVWAGVEYAATALWRECDSRTDGLRQLFGGALDARYGSSPLKRWNLFLRWMVRRDALDLGLWEAIPRRALVVPLDVHLARAGRELGLLTRKSNDKAAAIELTRGLAQFCPDDPVKYDFALYRAGQLRRSE